jgi:DnaJ-class molecular chaperone
MSDTPLEQKSERKKCDGCGGSGQIAFFRGVSRFVMDWDDCPDCLGTGYMLSPADEDDTDSADTITDPSD